MKVKILILIIIAFAINHLHAQDSKYKMIMEKTLETFDTATTSATLRGVSNTFERISRANNDEWLPAYYRAYSLALLAMKEYIPEKDSLLNDALLSIDRADKKSTDNSEILVVKSLITSMKSMNDTSGKSQSSKYLSKAMQLDPTNPRAYYVKGLQLMRTLKQTDSGNNSALAVFEEAYAKYQLFKPQSIIMPDWGQKETLEYINRIKSGRK